MTTIYIKQSQLRYCTIKSTNYMTYGRNEQVFLKSLLHNKNLYFKITLESDTNLLFTDGITYKQVSIRKHCLVLT